MNSPLSILHLVPLGVVLLQGWVLLLANMVINRIEPEPLKTVYIGKDVKGFRRRGSSFVSVLYVIKKIRFDATKNIYFI